MAIHDLSGWTHNHSYDPGNRAGERGTWIVVGITAATMVAEIVAGLITGSMALLADGWHMATHVLALSIAGLAYLLARRWSRDERFAFGTWKIEVLGAFSSALLLGVVAIAVIVESVMRMITPANVEFGTALAIATLGLAVNIVSALVLGHAHSHGHGDAHAHHDEHERDHDHHDHGSHHDHGHHHDHDHDHGHDHHEHAHGRAAQGEKHHDLNLRSAYIHVLADAVTSVAAIAALSAGLWLGWTWLDPVMGFVGALVILSWSKTLIADSARVLLDREMDSPVVEEIRKLIECDGDAEIADLHVWRVGRSSHAAVVTVVAERPLAPDAYRSRLAAVTSLMHVSVEVNRCPHGDCP